MKKVDLNEQEETARQALIFLKRISGMKDEEIALAAGWKSHQSIQQRRWSFSRIHPSRDVPRLAMAFGVDPKCFEMEPEDLVKWVAIHRPDLLVSQIGWLIPNSTLAA